MTNTLPKARKAFMQKAQEMEALAVRTGDQSYGAVIVKDDKIVGLGPSRVVVNGDPTAHAEMEAIRDASRHLKTADLSGCVMYSTSAPCAMCETAASWANIDDLISGSDLSPGGRPRINRC